MLLPCFLPFQRQPSGVARVAVAFGSALRGGQEGRRGRRGHQPHRPLPGLQGAAGPGSQTDGAAGGPGGCFFFELGPRRKTKRKLANLTKHIFPVLHPTRNGCVVVLDCHGHQPRKGFGVSFLDSFLIAMAF